MFFACKTKTQAIFGSQNLFIHTTIVEYCTVPFLWPSSFLHSQHRTVLMAATNTMTLVIYTSYLSHDPSHTEFAALCTCSHGRPLVATTALYLSRDSNHITPSYISQYHHHTCLLYLSHGHRHIAPFYIFPTPSHILRIYCIFLMAVIKSHHWKYLSHGRPHITPSYLSHASSHHTIARFSFISHHCTFLMPITPPPSPHLPVVPFSWPPSRHTIVPFSFLSYCPCQGDSLLAPLPSPHNLVYTSLYLYHGRHQITQLYLSHGRHLVALVEGVPFLPALYVLQILLPQRRRQGITPTVAPHVTNHFGGGGGGVMQQHQRSKSCRLSYCIVSYQVLYCASSCWQPARREKKCV